MSTSSPLLDGVAIDRRSEGEARAKLVSATLEAVPGGVARVDRRGVIVEANSAALRFLDYPNDSPSLIDDVATKTLREDGSPCPPCDHPIARAIATGEPQEPVTLGIGRRDGETVWALFRAVPTHDGSGAVTGAVVTFIDLTARRRAEDEQRRSEARWWSLAENLPDFVVIVNREARVQWMSHLLADYGHGQVFGTESYTYIAEEYLEDWKARFEIALESKRVLRLETRGSGPNDNAVWYETTFVPIVEEPDARVEHMLIITRDVSTRRAMMARLAEKERLASIGMLSASVAHEIMNPLTSVLANLDFAMSDRCPPGARKTKALIDAREGAARMQQI
ncbi:MAG: Sensory box histidine kinase/response regulator, partial [Labilithrix sp.]|nr:Sensory box histidine kinase/response regulator [Labilithrix sp.]